MRKHPVMRSEEAKKENGGNSVINEPKLNKHTEGEKTRV